ncbi:hypothetical protein D6851_04530 [Altericroceibacterium spongiae]|uniref:Uncharacterized protein n=1 Tax=Altericroceibacterium spongiae TaxID=2320269 RepID=A0A420EP97_9SPHN|nr:hypothetical protein [Altericroceibacterium spongiae]RKF22494.1 hypothetical protein D6851_04530 [Altericroceibacterium spongiae]
MPLLTKSCGWATALLLLAVANMSGWVGDFTAQIMFIIFGAPAVTSFPRPCLFRRKQGACS